MCNWPERQDSTARSQYTYLCSGLQRFSGARHLRKVPKSLRCPGDGLTLLQPGGSSSAVVNQAFGVRQEGGRPQRAQLEEALGGVAGQL